MPSSPCEWCAKPFVHRRLDARFCSAVCKARAHQARRPDLVVKYQATKRARNKVAPTRRTCAVCGSAFMGRPNATACSSICRSRRTGRSPAAKIAKRKRRAARWKAPHETFTDVEIFDRDGWRCGICNEKVDRTLKAPDRRSASIDHIVPLSVPGGPGHVRSNVQLAHLSCNVKKGARVAGSGEQLRLVG